MNLEHVIPAEWGPYVDIMAMWVRYGARVFDSIDPAAVDPASGGTHTVRVFWSLTPVPPTYERPWAAIAVYSEALADPGTAGDMLPEHVDHWNRFVDAVANYDAIVVHTPGMAIRMRRFIVGTPAQKPVFVVPLGWSPESWGRPSINPRHVHYDLAWWGSPVGRRTRLFSQLDSWCDEQGIRGVNLTGKFGRELVGALDTVGCVLYVAHSKVPSYSTWRLWQCMAAGVDVISEPAGAADTWPFVPAVDFALLPSFLDEDDGWRGLERMVKRRREGATIGVPRTGLHYTLAMVEEHYWRSIALQVHLAHEAIYG